MKRQALALALAATAALIMVAPAHALRAQIGDPFRLFSPLNVFSPFGWMGDGIAPRMLWISEEPGTPERNVLTVAPRRDGSAAVQLEIDDGTLTPGLPLLLDNCSRAPFTSEYQLDCHGTIESAHISLGADDDLLGYHLDVPGWLLGGAGNDSLRGGPAADHLGGEGDDDVARGGGGADTLIDSHGADRLEGDSGDDVIYGGQPGGTDVEPRDASGRDVLLGGAGNDNLQAIEGDRVEGGAGNDTLVEHWYWNGRASGSDALFGGDGHDTLNGGLFADTLDGGAGNDLLDGGPGPDTIAGGPGIDTLRYLRTDRASGHVEILVPISVTLDGLANDGESGEGDLVRADVENIVGGAADDVLSGSSVGNRLTGSGGHDTLIGLGGTDVLLGGRGDDVLGGGAGDDELHGHAGADRLDGGLGGDVLNGGDGDDVIEARDGVADKVSCGAGTDEARVDAVDVVAPGCERVIRAK